jgi:hypothetical protein
MRLSFITLFVSFLSLSLSFATNPQLLSHHDRKRSPVSSVISSRQYRLPRALVDVCINTQVDLFAGIGPLDLLSEVHLCLCLKVGIYAPFPCTNSSLLGP